MIDASLLFILVMIASLFMWIVLLFKIVMSPFAEKTKWKYVGILFIFAVLYIFVPAKIVAMFQVSGYGIPAAIVCSLFLGLMVFYFLVKMNIKKYEKQINKGR
ncbi:MAG: hypothetical protein WBK20_12495 [Spirochaetota bacterium]